MIRAIHSRDREGGAYYDRSWAAAVAVSPELVGITSFNEWREGTQTRAAGRSLYPTARASRRVSQL